MPGLRREEVAMLAGISVDYYTRLERGHLKGTSDGVLEAVASALQLDSAEREHLFDLARRSAGKAFRGRPAPRNVRPAIMQILAAITQAPAMVVNSRRDLLATNALARALYLPLFDGGADAAADGPGMWNPTEADGQAAQAHGQAAEVSHAGTGLEEADLTGTGQAGARPANRACQADLISRSDLAARAKATGQARAASQAEATEATEATEARAIDQSAPVNMARFTYLDPRAKTFFADWDRAAEDVAAGLRIVAGKQPHDESLTKLIGELSTRSEDFRQKWAAHDVRSHRNGIKKLHHPIVGALELDFEAMDLSSERDLALIVYTAAPGTPSADALRVLASWAATQASERRGAAR